MADVNATKIQAALKGHKGIVTNVDEFHDRFYLIRMLDIDNGDESLSANIPKESL
jgi:hypothetical protein